MIGIPKVELLKTCEVFQRIRYAAAQNFDVQNSNPITCSEIMRFEKICIYTKKTVTHRHIKTTIYLSLSLHISSSGSKKNAHVKQNI